MRLVLPGELNAPVRVASAPVLDPSVQPSAPVDVRPPRSPEPSATAQARSARSGGILVQPINPRGASVVPAPAIGTFSPGTPVDGKAADLMSVAPEMVFGAPRARTARAPGATPGMAVTRASEAPVMDGVVDDASWALADVATDFLQREPGEGQPASERTEVRILYDDRNLYVGLIAYDTNPSGILASELRRDALGGGGFFGGGGGGGGGSDDTFSVVLDTFHDGRSGFLFTVNPLGARYDATIRNESEINSEWDEAWEAAAQVTARGWEAELVIPLAILRFSSGLADWGVDFERQIRRKNEQVAWSNYRRDFRFIAVSQAGELRGFENLSVTQRFRLRPYFLGTATSLFAADTGRTNTVDDQFGVDDLKIQLTSNLTADLTYNTDFAQVELDDQRVNLTRFSLFFPEKRDFFLEGANNFSFGGRNRDSGFSPPLLRLFHSRNIGLSPSGVPIPIDFGTKMTGKLGSGTVGFLHVRTDDSEFGAGQGFTALRWRQDVLARSSVGGLVTHVEGPDGVTNTVIGADASFTFFDNLNISAFGARAADVDVEEGKFAGQFSVGWQSDLWRASLDVARVDPDFRSDLGFVLRDDVVRRAFRGSFNPRPDVDWLRSVSFDVNYTTFFDTRGDLVSRESWYGVSVNGESGDAVGAFFSNTFERLDFPFQIHPDVTIPPGEYTFDTLYLWYSTFGGRWVSVSGDANIGQFYDGTIVTVSPGLTFRLSENLRIAPTFSYNKIDLPGGSFASNVFNGRLNYSFSDRWLTDALVQYSNVSNGVSVFARLRYIYRVGDDIYLVYRQAGEYDGLRFGRHDRSLTLKVTRSFDW
ncbi:MAG TPA: DUF5916 domain-containing protein [Acidobacteriota bacterium]|nr:DUF5916 domain-containing protein [Acidobacteriota bacterium]